MAEEAPQKKKHKEWRKEAKKFRRKLIRQKLAEERNKKLAEEEAMRLNDPDYINWLQEQEELEVALGEQEERQQQEQEELWLRRELIAEKKFREQQRKYEAATAAKEEERLRIQKEFEELQQQAQSRREERKKREEQAKREYTKMLERIDEYIEFGGSIPEELTSYVQSNPNKLLCPFFSKTNACRFGMHCSRNHIRPKMSKILFFPNFFSHIKMEQSKDTEYGCDFNLEYTENEVNNDYTEFFNDVIEELKKYGEIMNFRTCMNSQPHLRGNVFVEYSTGRDALKAYMQLQGRYYASRQINVEFSPIVTWKSAICGLSYSNKCPKGRNCNFLHIFKNPGNVYNISVFRQEDTTKKTTRRETAGNSVSWNDGDDHSPRRNWRWSESPEADPIKKSKEISSTPKTKTESLCSRSRRSRSSERKKKYTSRSSSKKRRDVRDRNSSSRRRKDKQSKSKSPKTSRKRSEKTHRHKHHKEKKSKHKSKS